MFNKLTDAISWLESQRANNREMRFNNLKYAIRELDLNQINKIKKVHIAGTNGKGSTTAFLSNIAVGHQTKVGMFVSPYVLKFNERIQINNIPISDKELLSLINKIYKFQQKMSKDNITYSFFELSFLIALKYFLIKKVELLLIEVGIGGLLDTTNVLTYDLSLITNIGFDHQHILGNTLIEILYQKLGIVKPGGILITTIQKEYLAKVEDFISINQSKLIWINKEEIRIENTNPYLINFEEETYQLSLIGNHQKENASLAIKAYQILNPNYYDLIIKESVKNTKWMGRMEEIRNNIYLDGAHNINGIKALVETVKTFFNKREVKIIFSSLKDKDYQAMLKELLSVSSDITVTSFPDFRYESLKHTEKLSENIKFINNLLDDFDQYYEKISNDEIVLITGSLHFIGYAKKKLKGEDDDY